jgi:hypothetical protein
VHFQGFWLDQGRKKNHRFSNGKRRFHNLNCLQASRGSLAESKRYFNSVLPKMPKTNSRCLGKLINSAKGALGDPWLKMNSALPKNIVEKIVNPGRTKKRCKRAPRDPLLKVKYIFNSALPKIPKKLTQVAHELLQCKRAPRDPWLKSKRNFNSILPKKLIYIKHENFLTVQNY